jgi:hypothetical protein
MDMGDLQNVVGCSALSTRHPRDVRIAVGDRRKPLPSHVERARAFQQRLFVEISSRLKSLG